MALPACFLPLVQSVAEKVRANPGDTVRALSLGYPDLLATRAEIVHVFGPAIEAHLVAREDSAQVIRWHRSGRKFPEIFETVAFFKAIGVALDCIDISDARGFERIGDFNQPLPADMVGAYDLVLDFGTVEHCFNIAQAMTNCAQALREGGCVIHNNPLNVFNHGFYNLNPTFYADFYSQNGCEVLLMNGLHSSLTTPAVFDVPDVKRFRDAPRDSSLIVVAQRGQSQPIVWPVQHKYRKNPTLRG
jgi:SAM-dependent methyltransferase